MLLPRYGTRPKLRLTNILLPSKDFEFLKQHFTTELFNNRFSSSSSTSRNTGSIAKTNLLLDLIAELHSKSTDKTPRKIWNKLKELCENGHSILQEVDSWTEVDAGIRWQSHRKKERALKRPRFENIISELNNP